MATFLGFAVRADTSVEMGFDDDSAHTRSASLTYRASRSRVAAYRWSFMPRPDQRWNPMNIAGVVKAHKRRMRGGAFDWPGTALNEAGHKEVVAAKTISEDALLGDEQLTVGDTTDILPGRLIQLPGASRVYMVTSVGSSTTLTVDPLLRNDIAANTLLKATIVPRVMYDPEMDGLTTYVDSRPQLRIRLVEI